MKIISVVGYSNSGKTTVIEHLVPLLKKEGYSVGTLKNIHCTSYDPDQEGTDTWRHKEAGADVTVGYGQYSTDIMIQKRMDIDELLTMFNFDILLLEGVRDLAVPRIITAKSPGELKHFMNDQVMAISGVVANELKEWHGYPVINVLSEDKKIVEMITAHPMKDKQLNYK